MSGEFVNQLASVLKIDRRDLVEKDVILHQMLTDLSQDSFFSKNFVFKGGTCLIKCYFGYLRFSEDIDFTWNDQSVFRGKSQGKIRSYLSGVIDKTGAIFEQIAKKRGLDFKCVKSNANYVELGGSDKTCTFKVWYDAAMLRRRKLSESPDQFCRTDVLRSEERAARRAADRHARRTRLALS